jgi:Spy/CpxP family protein refolding chaperone
LWHREDLGLTPTQVEGLERLRLDFQRQAIKQVADQRVAELDLATLLRPDPTDPTKAVDLSRVEATVHEIERLRADLEISRIRTIEQGKALLTPDQRAKLAALLASYGAPAMGMRRLPPGPPQ